MTGGSLGTQTFASQRGSGGVAQGSGGHSSSPQISSNDARYSSCTLRLMGGSLPKSLGHSGHSHCSFALTAFVYSTWTQSLSLTHERSAVVSVPAPPPWPDAPSGPRAPP